MYGILIEWLLDLWLFYFCNIIYCKSSIENIKRAKSCVKLLKQGIKCLKASFNMLDVEFYDIRYVAPYV